MNDMLVSALCARYGIDKEEAMERITAAKRNGELFDLYSCAMLNMEMEMIKDVR